MKANQTSHSGFFNPRIFLAFGLCSLSALLAMLSFAANPPSGIKRSAAFNPHGDPRPLKSNATMATASTGGPGWSVVASPNSGPTVFQNLIGVACASASECWAVGYGEDGSGAAQTRIERWDGTSWTIVTSAPNGNRSYLNGVTCASASDCWAVGYYLTRDAFGHDAYEQTLVEHWDGSSWGIVSSGNVFPNSQYTANRLNGVTCVSASDCWAVGWYQSSQQQTLILHWNGGAWGIVPSPNHDVGDNFLNSVTCASASDCWASGAYHDSANNGYTLIEHWDGTSWTVVTLPNSGSNPNYISVAACTSASDCWAVGESITGTNTSQTLIERWNGTSWSIVTSPNTSDPVNFLGSVFCESASNCWAFGSSGTGANASRLIEHWNGTSWTIVPSRNASIPQGTLFSPVTCGSAGQCWTVGISFTPDFVPQPIIEVYNPLGITSITRLANGHIFLQGSGVPSAPNNVEFSPDLSPGSFAAFPPITPDMTGAFQFEAPVPSSQQQGFLQISYIGYQ